MSTLNMLATSASRTHDESSETGLLQRLTTQGKALDVAEHAVLAQQTKLSKREAKLQQREDACEQLSVHNRSFARKLDLTKASSMCCGIEK